MPMPQSRQIIVDGSNVMHWGGDASLLVLCRVLKDLQTRGFAPIVYFDANAGFKLGGQARSGAQMAERIGLDVAEVNVVPSGVSADGIMLAHGARDGLRIVTNDRFLDWKSKFPQVGKKGFLIKGKWQQGTVILRDNINR
ncbi:hypothetical protein [Yoonia sp.]|uniref:NYN domain-containing protein n=1 Tax=Yoonia sp. TaxID=2212373 RepID=UPI0025EBE7AD|nr:hypothetical protein [Yoonia sp.]